MISLKEHNNVVEKLMKELQNKQKEVQNLTKKVNKGPQQIPQLQPSITEQNLNKKITQLNKEYKEKISTLNQQLRNKSNQK